LGNFGCAVAMTAPHAHRLLPSLALAAIVGMLSVAGEASACSVQRASTAASACCAGTACCCEPTKVEPHPESADRTTSLPLGGDGLSLPASPCHCRPSEPTEPASKSESPSPERRTDQDRARSGELIFGFRPAIVFVRPVLPTESPPRAPLYLRISRLLI